MIYLLDNTTSEPYKFETRNRVEINDESRGTDNEINQIRFKKSMIKSNLSDYSDAYVHVKGTVEVPNTAAQGAAPNNRNKI